MPAHTTLADLLAAGQGGDADILDIIRERYRRPNDQAFQDAASLADHQAFARALMQDAPAYLKPLRALGLTFAIPGYEAAKAAGWTNRDPYTSNPSLASMLAGYKGLWQGMTQ